MSALVKRVANKVNSFAETVKVIGRPVSPDELYKTRDKSPSNAVDRSTGTHKEMAQGNIGLKPVICRLPKEISA